MQHVIAGHLQGILWLSVIGRTPSDRDSSQNLPTCKNHLQPEEMGGLLKKDNTLISIKKAGLKGFPGSSGSIMPKIKDALGDSPIVPNAFTS